MSNKLFQDSDGNQSSKRIAALYAGGLALALSFIAVIWGLAFTVEESALIIVIIKSLLWFSGSCLGISLGEKLPNIAKALKGKK